MLVLYRLIAPILAPVFLGIAVLFAIMVWARDATIKDLQTKLITNQDQEIRVVLEQQAATNEVSAGYEQKRTDREVTKEYTIREVEKIISVPSYSSECFDPSGLHAYNEAIAALNSSRESSAALSASSAAE